MKEKHNHFNALIYSVYGNYTSVIVIVCDLIRFDHVVFMGLLAASILVSLHPYGWLRCHTVECDKYIDRNNVIAEAVMLLLVE